MVSHKAIFKTHSHRHTVGVETTNRQVRRVVGRYANEFRLL